MKPPTTCLVCLLSASARHRLEIALKGQPSDPTAVPPVPPVARLSYRAASTWAKAELGASINYQMIRRHRLEHMSAPPPEITVALDDPSDHASATGCPDGRAPIGTGSRSGVEQEGLEEGGGLAPAAPPPPGPPPAARQPAPVMPGIEPEGGPVPEVVAELEPGVEGRKPRRAPSTVDPKDPKTHKVVMHISHLPTDTETPVVELLRAAANGHGRINAANATALDKWSTEFFRLVDRFKKRRAAAVQEKRNTDALEADVALGQLLVHGGHPLAQICKARKQLTGLAMSPATKRALGAHEDETAGIKGLIGQLGELPPPIDGDEPDAPEEEAEVAKGYPEEEAPPEAQTAGVASFDDLPEEEPPGFEDEESEGMEVVAELGREDEAYLVQANADAELASGEGQVAGETQPAALEPTGTEGGGGTSSPRPAFVWQPKPRSKSPV
jgi:hypothetical protein